MADHQGRNRDTNAENGDVGMGQGEREGIYVYVCLIHFVLQQKLTL